MFSDSAFCVLSEVQITLKYPEILWKIFNLSLKSFFRDDLTRKKKKVKNKDPSYRVNYVRNVDAIT